MRLKIRYTAGNPPVEHEQTHDFPDAPIVIEVDIPKMEIWATLAERRDPGGWTARRQTLYIKPEIDTPRAPAPTVPPIGLLPRAIATTERYHEVCGAIARYYQAGLPFPLEWIEEYNELAASALRTPPPPPKRQH